MKKLLALLLILCLSLSMGLSLAEDDAKKAEKIKTLKAVVDSYMAKEGFKSVKYDEERELYSLAFNLDKGFKAADVTIYLYDDMISVSAEPQGLVVPEELRNKMAVFLTLANDACFYAQFRMTYEDGWVRSRSYQVIENVFPGEEEIDTLINVCLWDLEDFGEGIMKLSEPGNALDPHAMFNKLLKARDGE